MLSSGIASIPTSRAAVAITNGESNIAPAIAWMRSRRSSAISCSGSCSRAATTARQAWTVAGMRGRSRGSIGIPKRRWISASACDWRSGVNPFSRYSSGERESTIMRGRHSIWSP
jgi:hypothetical protein